MKTRLWNGKSRLTRKRPWAQTQKLLLTPAHVSLPFPLPPAPCASSLLPPQGRNVHGSHRDGLVTCGSLSSHKSLDFHVSLLGDQLSTLLSRGLKEAKTSAGPEGEGINQIPFGNQARNVIQAGAKGLLGFFVVWVFFPYFFHMQ